MWAEVPGSIDRGSRGVRWRRWLAIGAIALVARLGAAIATGGLRHPELNEYDDLARSMLRGAGFTYGHIGVLYHSYAPPLCAWISAASYWLSGSIVVAMLLQIAAGAALAVVAGVIAERLFGSWLAGMATGLLVAFHPGLVIYSAMKSHPLTFDALFFTLALLQSFRLVERLTLRRALELGVVVGIGTLSRATIIIFLPIAGVWLLAVTPRPSRPAVIRHVVAAGLCAAAIIAPWTIRTSLLHHQFVFLLTTDSEDFWRGNNPNATGHSYIDAQHIVLEALPPEELADLRRQPDELAQRQWFSTHAWAFIRANPVAFVRLAWLKFFHFWWFAPQTGVLYPGAWLRLYMTYYVATLLFAVAGVRRIVQLGAPATHLAWVIGVFLLALSGLQSLYYVEGRHRWAVEPMVLVISGGGVAALVERRKRAPQGRAVSYGATTERR